METETNPTRVLKCVTLIVLTKNKCAGTARNLMQRHHAKNDAEFMRYSIKMCCRRRKRDYEIISTTKDEKKILQKLTD